MAYSTWSGSRNGSPGLVLADLAYIHGAHPSGTKYSAEYERATYRKVTWRLMPFLFVCYVFAYVDRVNVGFAKLQMQRDLSMSDAVYGIGAGIFFLGYFIFEIPANMMMQRLGARLWLGPIMILWGMVAACTMFVRSATSFYVLRFVLGIVESGFFPGVILYLTYWYTRQHRAKMVAAFMTAIPLSGVVAGPISGAILAFAADAGGLRAWQWLFLLEGIPSILAGAVAIFFLDDNPSRAKWLTSGERGLLLDRLEREEATKRSEGESRHRLIDAFKSGQVWLLCIVYFGFVMANYGLWFWLPQMIKDTLTKDPWKIGLVSVIPWAASAIVMVVYAHHSDVTGERRWHLALAGILGGVAFSASRLPGISGSAGSGRSCPGGDRGHVRPVHVLGAADIDPVRLGRRRGHRVDQLGGQSGRLREPVHHRPYPRCDRQHDAGTAGTLGVVLDGWAGGASGDETEELLTPSTEPVSCAQLAVLPGFRRFRPPSRPGPPPPGWPGAFPSSAGRAQRRPRRPRKPL